MTKCTYRATKLLGSGAEGAVFEAERMGERVAVKVPRRGVTLSTVLRMTTPVCYGGPAILGLVTVDVEGVSFRFARAIEAVDYVDRAIGELLLAKQRRQKASAA